MNTDTINQPDEDIAIVDLGSVKYHTYGMVNTYFDTHFPEKAEEMLDSFRLKYETALLEKQSKDMDVVDRLKLIIAEFRPALAEVLDEGEHFDTLFEYVRTGFNVTLAGAERRKKIGSGLRKPGPVLPGSDKSMDIRFICSVCKEDFDIPEDIKSQILEDGDDDIEFPLHCDIPMQITIMGAKSDVREEQFETADGAELYSLSGGSNADELTVLSVGIDIGSSTSHLIFSNLTLQREQSFFNMTKRFFLVKREIMYEGQIIDTPLVDRYTIDVEAVVDFIKNEFDKAGIDREMVDTGAVIVTGETAKKQNADEIVRRVASESGKFVSAAAGPNFESVLGAMGSGIVRRSGDEGSTILNVDIGGGTSNLAIVTNGQVHSTSCINVGGRLLGIDEDFKIWRIDGPTTVVMNHLGLEYQLGDIIAEEDVVAIANEYAKALVEVMQGPATSYVAKELMMTEDLDFSIPIDEISFSGGVSEMIFSSGETYNDIGNYLAQQINVLCTDQQIAVIEPENKIRATVIGAGAFSLSVSGSTIFFDDKINFPLINVPVLPVLARKEEFSLEHIQTEIDKAFRKYDLIEGEDVVALYFKEPIYHQYRFIPEFAKAIEQSLPNSIANDTLIILIFQYDMGSLLGLTMRDQTSIQKNLLCLDELNLEDGDWIDIGEPLKTGDAFPVTIKSLVFNQNKQEMD